VALRGQLQRVARAGTLVAMVRAVRVLAAVAVVAAPRAVDAGQCEGITVTVDNDDPGSGYSEERPENFQTHNVDACADTYRYLSRYVGDESTDGKAIWQPTIAVAGTYRVVTGFRASENRTDDADYFLYGDDGTMRTMVVDQRGDGCQLVELGEIWCTPGGTCRLELDGTDDMKSDAMDVTTFELVDCDPPAPPEPSPCDGLADAGFEICGSGPGICEGVYTGGEGCIALCTAVGMTCIERYGGEPGCLQEADSIPCDEVNDHASNYCVCQGEPEPQTTSGGDDGDSDDGVDGSDEAGASTDASAEAGGTTLAETTTDAAPPLDTTASLPGGGGDAADTGCGCTSDRGGGAWWLVAGLWIAGARRRRARWIGCAIATASLGCSGDVLEFESSSASTSTDASTSTSTNTTVVSATDPTAPTATTDPGTSTSTSSTDPETGPLPTEGSTDPSDTSADASSSETTRATDGESSSSTTGASTRGEPCLFASDCEPDAPYCAYGSCYDGSEGDPCLLGSDCPPASACVYFICRDGSEGDPCLSDGDCGLAPACVDFSCWDGSAGDPCVDNGDCDAAPYCAQSTCNAGEVGDPCDNDDDCDAAPFCVYAECREGVEGDSCVDDGDCSDDAPHCVGALCRDGSAGDPCEQPSDCMENCFKAFCT
jgi:hypothetical protein